MGREMPRQRISALARDLRSEETKDQTLGHVVRSAVDMIEPCESAAITLVDRKGSSRSAAATSDLPVRNDQLQREVGEGPCLDAIWTESVISVPDLRAEQRWIRWASRARQELGIGSLVCFQLFTHEDRVGALNLLSSRVDAFTEQDLDVGAAIAAQASVALAAAGEIDNLRTAIGSRTVIGQATGLLMAEYDLSADAAFGVLRRLSMEQNRRLIDVARELVEGRRGETTAAD